VRIKAPTPGKTVAAWQPSWQPSEPTPGDTGGHRQQKSPAHRLTRTPNDTRRLPTDQILRRRPVEGCQTKGPFIARSSRGCRRSDAFTTG